MNANSMAQIIFNTINLDNFRTTANNNINRLITDINNIISMPGINPEIAARLDAWRGLLEITLDERQRARYNSSRYSAAAAAGGGRRRYKSRKQRRSRKRY